MSGDRVTFDAVGFRDVYWCPYLNEPVIIEYRNAPYDGTGPIQRRAWCVNCEWWLVDASRRHHEFICHVVKP